MLHPSDLSVPISSAPHTSENINVYKESGGTSSYSLWVPETWILPDMLLHIHASQHGLRKYGAGDLRNIITRPKSNATKHKVERPVFYENRQEDEPGVHYKGRKHIWV